MKPTGSLALALLADKHGGTARCITHVQPFNKRPTTIRITCSIWILVLAMALITGPVFAQEPQASESANEVASTGPFRCYNVGLINATLGIHKLNFCVSEHGNIVRFKAPSNGLENIGIVPVREGYVACVSRIGGQAVVSHDAGNTESGFIGAPIITEPNGVGRLPLIITRFTVTNMKITQVFTANAADREVVITMTVQNLNTADNNGLRHVRLDRYFDGDIAGTSFGDRYSRSNDTVWGQEGLDAMMLSDANVNIAHTTSVQTPGVFDPADCGQASVATPTLPGDFVGRITYDLDVIPGFGAKVVQIKYRKL